MEIKRTFLNMLDSFTNTTHKANGSSTQILTCSCRIAYIAQAVNKRGRRRISVLIHCLVQRQPGQNSSPCPSLSETRRDQGHSNRQPWPPARGSGGHWGHCDMMASSINCTSMESSSSRREAGFWPRINNTDRDANILWRVFILECPPHYKPKWNIADFL